MIGMEADTPASRRKSGRNGKLAIVVMGVAGCGKTAVGTALAIDVDGVAHALVAFPEEGHGFRRQQSVQRALEAELWFYGRVLRFAVDTAPRPEVELR